MPAAGEFVALELDGDAHTGVPCWTGGADRWVYRTLPAVYRERYAAIRPLMCDGGIGLRTLTVIAAEFARHADHGTGRNVRATNEAVFEATGFTVRTVQRARECLRLLGLATEVMRGRQRTYAERMASWRMGDQARGWASVWALHDPAPSADLAAGRAAHAGVVPSLSPHLERSPVHTRNPCFKSLITTQTGASARQQRGAQRRKAPDEGGRRLATRWRAHADCPVWARRYSSSAWASMLAAPAAAGWTPPDLAALQREWVAAGHWIAQDPARPIALVGAMLGWWCATNALAVRPAALDEAREAAELAAARVRVIEQFADRARIEAERDAARAALNGAGHRAAMAAAAQAASHARSRRRGELTRAASSSLSPRRFKS